jgi:alcohol dehydrogenase class IV
MSNQILNTIISKAEVNKDWDKSIDIHEIFEIKSFCPKAFFGCGAINKLDKILDELKQKKLGRLFIITDKNVYAKGTFWNTIESLLRKNKNIQHVIYDKVRMNPTYKECDKITELIKDFKTDVIMAIGGGSVIDVAKTVALLTQYPGVLAKELYENISAKVTKKVLPILVINTTNGSGSELNKSAVIMEDGGYKCSFETDKIYPLVSIDDPDLTVGLESEFTIAGAVDAISDILESVTGKTFNPYAVILGKETGRLINKYLPRVLDNPKDLQARYWLLFARALGILVSETTTFHLPHAMGHAINGLNSNAIHGMTIGCVYPACLQELYKYKAKELATCLESVIPNLKGIPEEAEEVGVKFDKWLVRNDCKSKLKDFGISNNDISELTHKVFTNPSQKESLLKLPFILTEKIVSDLFFKSINFLG